MTNEKKKGGAGKFFLGALFGGIAGAIAGKFVKDKIDAVECECDECCGGECDECCGGECEEEKKVATAEKAEKKTKKAGGKKTSEKK